MPRQNKPISMMKKHMTSEEKIKKERQEETVTVGSEQLARAPTWLIDSIAKKEFKRLVKEFEKIDLVGNLDLNNIGIYCNLFSSYVGCIKDLKEVNKSDMLLEDKIDKKISIKRSMFKDIEQIRKIGSLIGMDINNRLKAANKIVDQEDEEISGEFGDI